VKSRDERASCDNLRKDKTTFADIIPGNYIPLLHQTVDTNQWIPQSIQGLHNGYHGRSEGSPFLDQPKRGESRMDDAARRVRVDVPNYHGKIEPHTFQDWITSLEVYFDWSCLSLDRQVRFAKMKLKGAARVWWHSMEERLHRLQQPPIIEWEEMKMKLQEKYIPLDYADSLFEVLIMLHQGNMTVDDYASKFHELSIRSQISETERQTLAQFKARLRDDICKEILSMRPMSVEEAYQMAVRLENQRQTAAPRRFQANWSSAVPTGADKVNHRTTTGGQTDRSRSYNPAGWSVSDER